MKSSTSVNIPSKEPVEATQSRGGYLKPGEHDRLVTTIRRAARIIAISSAILDYGWKPHPGMGRRELEQAIDSFNEAINAMEKNGDILPRRHK